MSKPFTLLTILLLLAIAAAHVYRVLNPFDVIVNNTAVPEWGSIAAAVVTAFLALMLFRESRS